MMKLEQALAQLLLPASSRAQHADHPAVVEGANKVSFKQLETEITRWADAFRSRGVAKGDPVVLCSANSAALVAAIVACWRLNALAIPVDFRLTPGEIENIAKRMSAKALFTTAAVSKDANALTPDDLGPAAEAPSHQDVLKLDFDAPALVILTSGTTGIPKGAVHDLRSLIENVVELGTLINFSEKSSALLPLPISHVFGLEVLLAIVVFGGTTIFCDFTPQALLGAIQANRPTFMVGVPTIYGALLAAPAELLASVDTFLSGGAPLTVAVGEQFERKFGKRITQGYGTTETKILTVNDDGPIDSIGKTAPSVTIEIVDSDDNVLPDGETGELRVRGNCLMKGYLNKPEETQAVLHGGHYHTGDIGYKKDDYVFISGRSKEMINVAGNKVFPSEVESVLIRHPLAGEVAVVGVPHSRLGQMVKAIVVLKPGDESNALTADPPKSKEAAQEVEQQFRDFCKQNLKRELRPMDWEFRPASKPLPKTHTGKIDKKQLEPTTV